jgi:lipoprotein LprG
VVRIAFIMHLAVTAAVLTVGCSPDAGNRSAVVTSSADNQAEALVRSCAQTTRDLASAHVVVDIQGKIGRLGRVNHIAADVQAKPMMANGQATYDNGVSAPFVLADDTVSIKMGNDWSEVGTTSALGSPSILDPNRGLRTILDSIISVRSAGTDNVDGLPTNKVTGIVPTRRVKEILPDAAKPADFTAWIRQGGEPVLVRATINVSAQQSLTVSLSKWNVPVSLTPAPTA